MRKRSFYLSFAWMIFLAAIVATRILVLTPVVVAGNSMYPTLRSEEKGISFKKYASINRFDIVVLDVSEFKNDKTYLIVKRVIGLPGETIECRNNNIYINGTQIYEPFVNEDSYTEDFKVVLGDDEYWCMGDNRSQSVDSRVYGAFKADKVFSNGFLKIPF